MKLLQQSLETLTGLLDYWITRLLDYWITGLLENFSLGDHFCDIFSESIYLLSTYSAFS